jgi:hypothetical protein
MGLQNLNCMTEIDASCFTLGSSTDSLLNDKEITFFNVTSDNITKI